MGGPGSGKPAGYGKMKQKSNANTEWEDARKKLLQLSAKYDNKASSIPEKLKEDNFRFEKGTGKKSKRGTR